MAGHREGLHDWSDGVHVPDLGHQVQAAAASGSLENRLLTCQAAYHDASPMRFCVSAGPAEDDAAAAAGSIQLHVTAPLVLVNALPMPVHVVAYGLSNWMNTR